MGRLKALLPWSGVSLLDYVLAELVASHVDAVSVVLGHASDELAPIVARAGARPIHNPRYAEGRATSIAAGAAAITPGTTHVLITSVDQPRRRSTIDALVTGHLSTGALISRAVHGGRHGHPTIFAARLFSELARVNEASEGMKSILRAHANDILDVEIDDPDVLLNLNTPDDYRAALNRG